MIARAIARVPAQREGETDFPAGQAPRQPDRQRQRDENLTDLGRHLRHLGAQVGPQGAEEERQGQPGQRLNQRRHAADDQHDEEHPVQWREPDEQQPGGEGQRQRQECDQRAVPGQQDRSRGPKTSGGDCCFHR